MKDISEVTCCVVTSGMYVPMAQRMAEEAKRVITWNPDCREFPSLKQFCIGDGFENFESVREFWPMLKEIDLFAFPDCHLPDLQEYLESVGKAVWGSRHGMDYELGRERFMDLLVKLDLDVPPHVIKVGVTELRDYLEDKSDIYVKISRYRGDMETFRWRNWAMDSGWIGWLRVNFGPLCEHIRFLCFDKIDTPLEIGGDTINVDGQWPKQMLCGTETKDKCFFSSVTEREQMPEQIQIILEAIAPTLSRCKYRNQMSFEVRVKGDKFFWIDYTGRAGLPSTASQHKLMRNFGAVIWAGANGELLEPDYEYRFSIECMITTKPDAQCWDVVEIPEELKPWAQFSNCCYVDGCYGFPPDELHAGDLGWLICVGNTPQEVLDKSKELADLLPDGLNADVESMVDLIKELEIAKEAGIELSAKPMPPVEEVISS